MSKEISVLENTKENEQVVNLESLASLTGFPIEMIKKELFHNEDVTQGVSLNRLRDAMADYIDATMLEEQ